METWLLRRRFFSPCCLLTAALVLLGTVFATANRVEGTDYSDGDNTSSFSVFVDGSGGGSEEYGRLTAFQRASAQRRKLKQESAPVNCSRLREEYYDEASARWVVPVGKLPSGELRLDSFASCAAPDDSVVLALPSAMARVNIDRTVNISKRISVTASFGGAPARAQLTCPDDESPVFDIHESGVLLENMEIVNCDLKKGDSPVTVRDGVEDVRLRRMSFRANSHTGNVATIAFSDRARSVRMTDVSFHKNNGVHSSIARFPRESILKNVNVSENNAQSVVLHFPRGADVSIDSLRAVNNEVTVIQIQDKSTMTLSDTIFASNGKNGSELQGGAISVASSHVRIKRCAFRYNSADKGGAVFATNSTVEVSDSTDFTNNSANEGGACFFESCKRVTISGASNFTNNSAHEGGGCFFEGGNATITNSTFRWNNATNAGGAVRSTSNALRLSKWQCFENWAGNSGGCLQFEDSSLGIFQSTVKKNEAKLAGALKVARSKFFTISQSRFVDNRASNTAGCFYFDESEGRVKDSRFKKNRAAYGGGAYVHACHSLLFSDTEFNSNEAEQLGGAIDVDIGTVEFLNVTLANNKAFLGGGLYFFGATVTGSEMRFRGNNASEGGALMARKTNITLCPREECRWEKATKLVQSNSRKDSFGVEAIQNIATNGGGGLDLEETNATIVRGTFKHNKGIDGGALHVSSRDCNVRVSQTVFDNNTADTTGGAVYARATMSNTITVTFVSVQFRDNSARLAGGACSLGSVTSRFRDCSFNSSTSMDTGGALAIRHALIGTSSSETTVIELSVFQNNRGENGSAIHAVGKGRLRISSSLLRENRAANSFGGAIFAKEMYLELTNVTVEDNFAKIAGGGLYLLRTKLQISDSLVKQNKADHGDGGGAIFVESHNSTVISTTFVRNSARAVGGAMKLKNSQIDAWNLTVIGNEANLGGGINAKYSQIRCDGCRFQGNDAVENGGAIRIASQDESGISGQFVRSRFAENRAKVGAAIYFLKQSDSRRQCKSSATGTGCGLVLIQASFLANNARRAGSVLHSNAKDLIFVHCSDKLLRGESFLKAAPFDELTAAGGGDRCPEWSGMNNSEPVLSAYASRVDLVFSQDAEEMSLANGRYRMKWRRNDDDANDDGYDYDLFDLVPGRVLPVIKLIPFDEYGNQHDLVLGGFKPVLESKSGRLLEGRVSAVKVEHSSRFSHVRTSHTDASSGVLGISFKGALALKRIKIKVNHRKCMVGEAEKKSGVLCEACDDSTYSFDPENESCRPCPWNGNCTGDFVFPQPGYWQRSPCDARIVECLNSAACSGRVREDAFEHSAEEKGYSSECMHRSCALLRFTENLAKECPLESVEKVEKFQELQCSEGYEGPLCGVCSKGCWQSGNYKCNRCSSSGWYVAAVLAATLVTIAVVAVMIRGNHVSSRELVSAVMSSRNRMSIESSGGGQTRTAAVSQSVPQNVLDRKGRPLEHEIEARPRRDVRGTGLNADRREHLAKWKICEILKVIINFLQSIAVATVINVEWARFIRGLLQASDIASGASIEVISSAVYCLCHAYSIRRHELSYYTVLATPFVLVLPFALFYAVKSKYRNYDFGFCVRRIVLSFVTVLFLNYLNVTKQTVEVFVSVKAPSHDAHATDSEDWTQYWVPDTSLEFLSPDHKVLFAVALVVVGVYSLGLPVISAVTLYKFYIKGQLGSNGAVYDILGFMYRGYNLRYCYWEAIIMLRKACLSMIAVFSFSLGGATQGLLATFVLVISLFLHTWVHPFRREFEVINMFESYSLIVSCQTFILSSFFVEDNASEKVRTFLSLYLGLCIIGLLLCLTYELIQSVVDFLRVKLAATYQIRCKEKSLTEIILLYALHCRGMLKTTASPDIELVP